MLKQTVVAVVLLLSGAMLGAQQTRVLNDLLSGSRTSLNGPFNAL